MKREDEATIKALLRSAEPSIRWKTRVHVLGEGPTSRPVRALREEIRRSPRVRALLFRRSELGRPGSRRRVYYKWQGVHWVLASLADLGHPEGDESLIPIRDRVLELWLSPSYYHEFVARTRDASYREPGVPEMNGRFRRCGSQQGSALLSILALGIADDRVHDLAERLLHWQWPDGGWNCDRDPAADTSSFMETLLPMQGLAVYGRAYRKPAATKAARAAAEVFLRRRMFKRATNGKVIAPDFVALHYPLYWHYDFLAGLKGMMRIGALDDPRCVDALDLLEERRLPEGGWPAEKRFYKVSPKTFVVNSDYVDWGGTSRVRMNEWVTADALAVLRSAGRLGV